MRIIAKYTNNLESSLHYSPILVKKYFKEWSFVKLTKKDITKVIADKYGEFTQKEIGEVVDTFLDTIKSEVSKGEKIAIPKFGSFELNERAARECRNPQTNERMMVAACKVPKFKPAKDFKDCVNQR